MKKFLAEVRFRITRNPVLIGAAALWGYETLTTGDPLTWRSVVSTAIGVLVRSKVVPAKEVADVTDFINDLANTIRKDAEAADAETGVKRLGGSWS